MLSIETWQKQCGLLKQAFLLLQAVTGEDNADGRITDRLAVHAAVKGDLDAWLFRFASLRHAIPAAGTLAEVAEGATAVAEGILRAKQAAAAASSAKEPPAEAQGTADRPQSRDRPHIGISLKAGGMFGTAGRPAGAPAQGHVGLSAATPAVTGPGQQGQAQLGLDSLGGSSEAAARLRAQLALPFVAAPEQTPELTAPAPAGLLQGQPSKMLAALQVSPKLGLHSGTLHLLRAVKGTTLPCITSDLWLSIIHRSF